MNEIDSFEKSILIAKILTLMIQFCRLTLKVYYCNLQPIYH